MTREQPIQHVAGLSRGDIVRNIASGQSYVVIVEYPDPVIAMRYVRVDNASEWVKVVKDETS